MGRNAGSPAGQSTRMRCGCAVFTAGSDRSIDDRWGPFAGWAEREGGSDLVDSGMGESGRRIHMGSGCCFFPCRPGACPKEAVAFWKCTATN